MGILEITEFLCSGIINEYSEKQKESVISSQRLLAAFVPSYSHMYDEKADKHIEHCYKAVDITKINNNNRYDYSIKHILNSTEKSIDCKKELLSIYKDQMYSKPRTQQLEIPSENCENNNNCQDYMTNFYEMTNDIGNDSNTQQEMFSAQKLFRASPSKFKSVNILQDTIRGYHEPCLEIFEDSEIENNENCNVHNCIQEECDEDEEIENKVPSSIDYSEKYNRQVQVIKNGSFKNTLDSRKLRCPLCRVGFRLENCPCTYFAIVPSPLKDSFVAEYRNNDQILQKKL